MRLQTVWSRTGSLQSWKAAAAQCSDNRSDLDCGGRGNLKTQQSSFNSDIHVVSCNVFYLRLWGCPVSLWTSLRAHDSYWGPSNERVGIFISLNLLLPDVWLKPVEESRQRKGLRDRNQLYKIFTKTVGEKKHKHLERTSDSEGNWCVWVLWEQTLPLDPPLSKTMTNKITQDNYKHTITCNMYTTV